MAVPPSEKLTVDTFFQMSSQDVKTYLEKVKSASGQSFDALRDSIKEVYASRVGNTFKFAKTHKSEALKIVLPRMALCGVLGGGAGGVTGFFIAAIPGAIVGAAIGFAVGIFAGGVWSYFTIQVNSQYLEWLKELAGTQAEKVILKKLQEIFSSDPDLKKYICPVTHDIMLMPVKLPCECCVDSKAVKGHNCPCCQKKFSGGGEIQFDQMVLIRAGIKKIIDKLDLVCTGDYSQEIKKGLVYIKKDLEDINQEGYQMLENKLIQLHQDGKIKDDEHEKISQQLSQLFLIGQED